MKKEIIGIVSGKGGVGKSTISCMMALAFAKRNIKTLLIDADLGLNNLDIILKVKSNNFDLKDVIKGYIQLDDAYIKVNENLSLISLYKTTDLSEFDNFKSSLLLEKITSSFDKVIIDAPAGIDSGFEFAIQKSDRIYIIINPNMSSISDALKVESIIKKMNKNNYSYILNRAENKNILKHLKYVGANVSFLIKDCKAFTKGNFYSTGVLDFIARKMLDENKEKSNL